MQTQNENRSFQKKYSLNIKGNLMDLSTAKVMGILNLTPDSFFDGGRYQQEDELLKQAEKMIQEKADFLDLGAFSSRPGAELISEEEELERLIPAVKLIHKHFPQAILSVDTYRTTVAKEALQSGASIINDISGGKFDSKMFSKIAEWKVPYILMHMKGEPKNMQHNPTYENVSHEIFSFFKSKVDELNQLGVNDIILDPGFGFGKSLEHNYSLLKNLPHFQALNCPILVGISRKGMIQKVINTNAQNALNGTTAAHVLALQNGASILRVHDVKEAVEAVQIVDFYQKQ